MRTRKTERAKRELAVAANLDWLQKNDPARFDKAMRLLAKLMADKPTNAAQAENHNRGHR
jgi:hypothetical protein